MERTKVQQKRCVYCGCFFRPDYRVKDRQKSCKSKQCQARRKKESQRRWLEKNPGYFRGRYPNTKEWRERNPDYQRRWRAKRREIQDEIFPEKQVKTIRLVVPERWFRGEIQDEIRFVRQCRCGFFVTGRGVQDTRRHCFP
jgi:hypothetical protein